MLELRPPQACPRVVFEEQPQPAEHKAPLALDSARHAILEPAKPVARSLPGAIFLILVAAFLLPGLIGHDPWKQDETYIFGIIEHLLDTGDWVVPTMAGEPFMEKPPLYYWLGAATARLFASWLPLHDGARLATGIFMMIACGSLGWVSRYWWNAASGRYSVFALLGCLGTVFYSHLMLTDIPVLAGFALAACGFATARTRAVTGGVVLGLGVGMGFLAKGMLAPGVLGLTAILLPLFFKTWRERSYYRGLAIALLTALPALLIWPVALYMRSPSLFMEWFWLNNLGRFVGFSVPMLGAPHTAYFWSETLPWFLFPALPLALMALWQQRDNAQAWAPVQFSLTLFAVLLAVLWISASARPNYALPLLVPLCLLAGPAVDAFPARLDRAWDWSSRVLFGTLAVVIWSIWAWLLVRGPLPESLAALGQYLPLDYRPTFDVNIVTTALLLTALPVLVARALKGVQGRGLVTWVAGLALCWGLISTLWLGWLDYAKSYRSVFVSMRMALPREHHCIASAGLGESERAMLHYILGVNTVRTEVKTHNNCDLLLINGLAVMPPHNVDRRWRLVWEGARPSDLRERFWLFEASSLAARLVVVSSSDNH